MTDRRTRIVDAAARLMSQQGYQHTSIDNVIEEAGLCGKAHFYHYFRSKEELGYAVVARAFEQFADEGLAILRDPIAPPLERLDRFLDSVVAMLARRGCRGGCPFGNLAIEMSNANEGFRQRLVSVFDRWAAQIEAVLWEARPRLREGVEAGRLARFIIATLEGATMMARVEGEIAVMSGIAEELKRYVAWHQREPAAQPQTQHAPQVMMS